MTPLQFIQKWDKSELKESSAAQSHFLDVCLLIDYPPPTDSDVTGDSYCFEKGATKTTGGKGFADVWKKGCFGWEYKGPNGNLTSAYAQLQRYAVALENPPLLIVSDTKLIVVHTNWTNSVSDRHEISLHELLDAKSRTFLRNCFTNPDALKPKLSRDDLTKEAANEFSALAQSLRDRGFDAEKVAHFVNRLIFCMFAEDVGLLPSKLFNRAIELASKNPDVAQNHLMQLFSAMKCGDSVGFEAVPWFNGELFEDDEALPLSDEEVNIVRKASNLYWADIDPSILGTLFERGLDPSKRSQLGAHYTDRDKVMMIIEPVLIKPLVFDWEETFAEIRDSLGAEQKFLKQAKQTPKKGKSASYSRKANVARQRATILFSDFIERLSNYRILDPACGSGNFLYLALKALKDLEHRINVEAESVGLARGFPRVGPECVKGIEINPYAAELARISIWIGEIQWMKSNGFEVSRDPVLKSLESIECRDALLNKDGTEAIWPDADIIVGNPPYLGAKLMYRVIGQSETKRIRDTYSDRLPGFSDYVCFWFEKARLQIVSGKSKLAGLVATSSIAKNTNLPVMRKIVTDLEIFNAYSNEPWFGDGAAVRVALIAFGKKDLVKGLRQLDGKSVGNINPNLTSGTDTSNIQTLPENKTIAFVGVQKSGPFDVPGDLAREWINLPVNPNGRSNREILWPTLNGSDITSRHRDTWMIDFPIGLTEEMAALWEAPFEYLTKVTYDPEDSQSGSVKEARKRLHAEAKGAIEWWTLARRCPGLRRSIENLNRFIVTPMTAKHRIFVWVSPPVLPDNNTIVIAKDDDVTFGLLHSRMHLAWTKHVGNRMGNASRYNTATTFETFPFPDDLYGYLNSFELTDREIIEPIVEAARDLNVLRENWLNPKDLVNRTPEIIAGFPDRLLPVGDKAASILKQRTLTNLYNKMPEWLRIAHHKLDRAVADAYGWKDAFDKNQLSDEKIVELLCKLNQSRQ